MPVPVIETDRLRLRGHALDDFTNVGALWADADVTRYIGGRPQTTEEAWARLLRYVGHWALLGFGYWLVEEKGSGDFVGEVGFADYKRDLQPPLNGVPEIGWVITPAKQGKGYATEAVPAALKWGREHWGAVPVACIMHPDHAASLNVADKCGFVTRGLGSYKGSPTLILYRNL